MSDYTAEDLAEIEVNRVRTGAVAMATGAKVEGLYTIHEIGRMGDTKHLGFGQFETVGPNWKLYWNGGGAMYRTASGKAYTPVILQGTVNPFKGS